MGFKNGLKAQKLLAQGTALGIMAISKTPCKGKSFVNCLVLESFCPYRAYGTFLIASALYLFLRPVTVGSGCVGAFLIASALYLFLRPVTVGSGRVELTCET